MTSLTAWLTDTFADAFETCGLERELGTVVQSQRPELGQFQCNGAFAAASAQKKNPRKIAEAVLGQLDRRDGALAQITIAGPGFINVSLSDHFLAAHVQTIIQDERLGCPLPAAIKTIIVDFAGPNVAKPLHVGHLRPTIIGDCLQRLCRFVGHKVLSDIHLGDWGTQMGMLICEIQRHQPELPYFDAAYSGPYPTQAPVTIADLQRLYPQAAARSKDDPQALAAALRATAELQQGRAGYRALWGHFVKISNQDFEQNFNDLGVEFDLWFGESDYQQRIPPLLARLQAQGQAQLSEGAWVVPVSHETDQREIPPLILVKSDGGYLYSTTDLATIEQRVIDFQADEILYVVDARQSLHFEQVFRAARRTGLAQDTAFKHLAFGTMNGPDGKSFKTRSGGVMRLQILIELVQTEALKRMQESGIATDYDAGERQDIANKVGLAALKFADLMHHRTSDYIFDLEKFTKFEGRTGPYLLYTAVRIKSILRKAAANGLTLGSVLPATDSDRDLMLTLTHLPDAVQSAFEAYLPHHLCDFAYMLAQTFNRFYNQNHILGEPDPAIQASWLTLAQLCLSELELILSLLGIEAPERM